MPSVRFTSVSTWLTPVATSLVVLVETGIMGDGLSFFERADDRVIVAADPELEPDLALLFG